MLALSAFLLLVSQVPATVADTGIVGAAAPAHIVPSLVAGIGGDTVRRRPKAIEVSDWYERRLRIHKVGAATMLPLFGLQAIAGNQIFQQGKDAPAWARAGHRVGATGLAVAFTSNTVTGLWNLWESRRAPGAARRNLHALFMLASDAGFTYAGARLSDQAENSADKRREHRNLAYASMASALVGTGVMLVGRDD